MATVGVMQERMVGRKGEGKVGGGREKDGDGGGKDGGSSLFTQTPPCGG